MNKPWPKVRLGEVLRHRKEFITIDDLATYRRPRVQLHAQGIVLRDEVPGALIKTKKQQVCHAGEFLVAEIDAKVGGFGMVPDALEGALVSSHYFLFAVDTLKLEQRFLEYFSQTPAFREQVEAQGSTNYAAIRPAHVLGYEIPLPPLGEQRRIVARIDELAGHIHEASTLRQQAEELTGRVISSFVSAHLSAHAKEFAAVGELTKAEGLQNGKSVKASNQGQGIRCLTLSANRGGRIDITNSKPVPLGEAEAKPYLVKDGDVFIVRGNGSKELCGMAGLACGNPDNLIFPDLFIRVRLDTDRVFPAYFIIAWNSLGVRGVIEEKARTTSGIWKINQGHIAATSIPLPSRETQLRIVAEQNALQAEVDALRRRQAENAADLDALLPSILNCAFAGGL